MHDPRRPAAPTPLALLLLLALAACAPLDAGDASRVEYRAGATYPVPADSALYVELDVPLERTGLTTTAIRSVSPTWIPLGITGESANASRLVTLMNVEAPEDWQVRLWRARLVRERPVGERDAPWSYRLELELRVDVPASAYDLTRRVRADLQVRGGERLPVDVLVEAR